MATTPDARPSRPSSSAPALEALGVPADAGPLYEQALTHRSYAFEQTEPVEHNERLEFLGDAVLGTVVTELIYSTYPELAEGDMARLRASVVNTVALADLARSLGLGDHIRLGKGEAVSGGRDKPSLLANALEAVIGAIYLERGLEAVTAALRPLFRPLIAGALAGGRRYDAKTALQEVTVRAAGEIPTYRVAGSGPDHDKRFVAHVYVGSDLYGTGGGRSKKQAEQEAARAALVRLGDAAGERAPDAGSGGTPDARAS